MGREAKAARMIRAKEATMDLREFLRVLDEICSLPTAAEVEEEIRAMGIKPDEREMVWE